MTTLSMWLINTLTYQLEEHAFENRPRYAILSHTWSAGSETTFQDFQRGTRTNIAGYKKIIEFCDHVQLRQYDLAWVDTCCIDKTSSAALSEAINAMWSYYKEAACCYAYLADSTNWYESRWWKRGWTLQELLAPNDVVFVSSEWDTLGRKSELAREIAHRFGIPESALRVYDRRQYTAAEKFSWAAGRKTSRMEDRAYSLLGLFNIHMPLLYGEGQKAFERLQLAIMQKYYDMSILTWLPKQPGASNVLAKTPDEFGGYPPIPRHAYQEHHRCKLDPATITPPRVTPWGIELLTQACELIPWDNHHLDPEFHIAIPTVVSRNGLFLELPYTVVLALAGPGPFSYQRLDLCRAHYEKAIVLLEPQYETRAWTKPGKFFLSFDDDVFT